MVELWQQLVETWTELQQSIVDEASDSELWCITVAYSRLVFVRTEVTSSIAVMAFLTVAL